MTPTGLLDVAFDLWLPRGTPPANGWPVVIYGTGSVGNKNTAFAHAAVLASHGLAVIGVNPVGRGGGARTTMTARLADGTSMTFAAPGLGSDADGNGTIAAWEPQRVQRPYALLNTSSAMVQIVAQHFALVRAIQSGVDVNGDGAPDLDQSRMYFLGQSLGATWGMSVFAFEPAIRAAVFTVPTGTLLYNSALSPAPGNRPGLAEMLAARSPSLINAAQGLSAIDGVAIVNAPHFNENLPLRNEAPRINSVPGAIAIQNVMDHIVWAAQIANPVAAAPLLRHALPAGARERPFILQWARSDQVVANPSAAELIRSGDFADRVYFYRHDLNFPGGGVPPNPHGFLSMINPAMPNTHRVALGAQHQIGAFFESDGATLMPPTPTELWEAPIRLPLPEDLFYLPRPR